MSDQKTMMDKALKGLGIPEGTSMWIWPKKPLGKPDGKGPKTGAKPSVARPAKSSKGPKQRGGQKQKKGDFGSWM